LQPGIKHRRCGQDGKCRHRFLAAVCVADRAGCCSDILIKCLLTKYGSGTRMRDCMLTRTCRHQTRLPRHHTDSPRKKEKKTRSCAAMPLSKLPILSGHLMVLTPRVACGRPGTMLTYAPRALIGGKPQVQHWLHKNRPYVVRSAASILHWCMAIGSVVRRQVSCCATQCSAFGMPCSCAIEQGC